VFTLTTAPAGMTIDDATGVITWTPAADQLGDFNVAVLVDDGAGGVATQQYVVCVQPSSSNHAPVITSAAELFATGDYAYQVRALDANGDALAYSLDVAPAGMTINAATGLITWATTPADEGTHDVAVRVVDGRGGSDTQTFTLTVNDNVAPTFTTAPITSATVGVLYVYDVNAVDADTIHYSLVRGPSGMTIDAANGVIQWTPEATHFAQERVVVEANDGRGGRTQQAFVIQVATGLSLAGNVAPRFITTAPANGAARQVYRYDAVAVDPNGDPVTYDLVLAPAGMAIDPATGAIAWMPRAEQVGAQQFVIRARDNQGGVTLQSVSVEISAANHAPVFSSAAGTQAVVGAAFGYMVAAQDADGDALSFTLVDGPDGATLGEVFGVPNRGILVWFPQAAGPESFTIEVRDNKGGTATQQFVVTAVASAANHGPVITTAPRTSIPLGRTWFYLPEATDEDHDRLLYALDEGPAGMSIDPVTGQLIWTPSAVGVTQVTLRVSDGRGGEISQTFEIEVTAEEANGAPTIVSVPLTSAVVTESEFRYRAQAVDPDHDPVAWSLVDGPEGVSIDPLSGEVRWTPRADQLGAQTIVIQVVDPFLASATQTIHVVATCCNQPPAILSRPVTTANVDARYIYGVRAIDPENAALAYSLVDAPSGMTIDATTGVIRWTPTAAQLGVTDVRVRVTDTSGASAEQAYAIEVTQVIPDLAPIFRSRAAFRATVGALYEYVAEAVDPEGSAVTYSLLSAPAGMTIDPNTGLIAWAPSAAQAGPHVVIVAADDAAGNRGQQRYALLARVNQAPEIVSDAPTTISAGAVYLYDVQVDDPENDPIAYTLLEAPSGMTIDGLGRIAWTTAPTDLGAHAVTVQAADAHGLIDTQSFTLTVAPDTIAPRVSVTLSTPRVAIGSPVVITVQAMDDVGIAELALTINGQPVTLSEQGTAIFTPDVPGQLNVVATATDAAGNVGQANALLRAFDPADTDGPLVEITSPGDGTVVTSVTDIFGTVSDANLLSYRVEYARADLVNANDPTAADPDWRLIAESSASVVNDTLGAFDPTMLMNDSYLVRVIAEDTSGNLTARTVALSIDGDLKLGEFALSFTDLTVPVAGIPVTIGRTYDTRQSSESGDFGYGWTLQMQNGRIRESVPVSDLEAQGLYFGANPFEFGTRVFITGPDGRRRGFTFEPTPQFSLFGGGYWLPAFRPDPGVYDTLEVDSTALQRRADGTFGLHLLGFPYNPSVYRLTSREGTVYQYDQFLGLQTITDRNGTVLTFTPDGVTSNAGVGIQFVRDSFGRIVQIIDPSGAAIRYQYDDAGDLVVVRDQADLPYSFSYGAVRPHYLDEYHDPLGRLVSRADYDDQGRLVELTDANGNSVAATTDVGASTQQVRDANGNVSTYVYDARGNVSSVTGPLGSTMQNAYDENDNLTSTTDALGNTTSFAYDSRGNLTVITDPLGNQSFATFDAFGHVTSTTDALGRSTALAYDSRGNLVQTIDMLGNKRTATRDERGRITKFVDAAGIATKYEYGTFNTPTRVDFDNGDFETLTLDALGRPLVHVDGAGGVLRNTFDAAGRPVSRQDPDGGITTYAYTGEQVTKITDPLGRATTYEYDGAGRLVKIVDPEGGETRYVYDAVNNLVSVTDPSGVASSYQYDAQNRTTASTNGCCGDVTYEYDLAGNVTKRIDALGRETRYEYDALNRLVKTTDALGGVFLQTYDLLGNLATQTDANGGITSYEYDANGRLVATTDALRNVSRTEYDGAGRIVRTLDPLGNATEYFYNARNILVGTRDALGHEFTYTLDGASRMTMVKDELGVVSTMEYDDYGRAVAARSRNGGETRYEYDLAGNLLSMTDPLGAKTTYEYDDLGRMIVERDALGNATFFTYDGAGRMTSLTDPLGQVTSMEYDDRGRLVRTVDPNGLATTRTYDAVGNLETVLDRAGRTLAFSYDALNRVSREDWKIGASVSNSIVYDYDAVGNLLEASDAFSHYVQTYDALHRLQTVDNGGTPNAPRVVLSYSYDAASNLINVHDDTGAVVTSRYDGLNRLASRDWSGGGLDAARFDLVYDAAGRRTGLNRYSDLAATQGAGGTAWTYGANGDLDQITHRDALDAAIASYDLEFDLASRLVRKEDHGNVHEYDYDDIGQLIEALHDGQPDENYVFDGAGNRTSSSQHGDAYETATGNRTTTDGVFNYAYDPLGNLATKTEIASGEVTTYTYDHRNRLTVVERRSQGGIVLSSTEFRYDLFNRRIAKITNGQALHTVYDGQHAWADYDAAGQVDTRYLFGPRVDEIVARQRTGEGVVWYLADELGTVRDLVDSAGALLNHVEYDSFGRVMTQTNAAAGDRFLFTGREYDAELGLYYYRARYYDPSLGRFIAEDPSGFDGNDANLYRYVGNSPLNGTDPTGLIVAERPEVVPTIVVGATIGTAGSAELVVVGGGVAAGEAATGAALPAIGGYATTTIGSNVAAQTAISFGLLPTRLMQIAQYVRMVGSPQIAEKVSEITLHLVGHGLYELYLHTFIHCEEVTQRMPQFFGWPQDSIRGWLTARGYTKVPANRYWGGGEIWSRSVGGGMHSVVRLDPDPRDPRLGIFARPSGLDLADEKPHVHKECVASSKMHNGNFDGSADIRFDDRGHPVPYIPRDAPEAEQRAAALRAHIRIPSYDFDP